MTRRRGFGNEFVGRALYTRKEEPVITSCSFCGRTRYDTNLIEGSADETKAYICAFCAKGALEILIGEHPSVEAPRKETREPERKARRLRRRLRLSQSVAKQPLGAIKNKTRRISRRRIRQLMAYVE